MKHSLSDIHGHEVMNMMRRTGKTYTRETLIADIISTFGSSTTFCTCAVEGMNPEALIDFLQARNKFIVVDGGFKLADTENCDDH